MSFINFHRDFVRKYMRPRDAAGHWLPGFKLMSRAWKDNRARWVFWPNDETAPQLTEREQMVTLNRAHWRVVRDICVFMALGVIVVLITLHHQVKLGLFDEGATVDGVFDIIVADPPWRSEFGKTDGRATERVYPTMLLHDIKALQVPAAPAALLFPHATVAERLNRGSNEMIRAYVLVTASAGRAQHVAEELRGKDGIVLVDAITGEYDVIAQVEASDIPGIGRLILERIQSADGVVKTITCLAV